MSVKIGRVFIKIKNAIIAYAEPLKFLSQFYGEFIEFKEYTLKKFDENLKKPSRLTTRLCITY